MARHEPTEVNVFLFFFLSAEYGVYKIIVMFFINWNSPLTGHVLVSLAGP